MVISFRRGFEEAGGRLGPELGHGDAEGFLAPEVMEECPFRNVGCPAEVIHCGGGVALARMASRAASRSLTRVLPRSGECWLVGTLIIHTIQSVF
jgi:hypothetical protein